MRRLLSPAMVSLTLAGALLTAAPAGAVTDLRIEPASIARGPDVAVPYLDGTTIVDGQTRVPLPGHNALLYGTWRGSYVAATGNAQWGNVRLWLVPAQGTPTRLRSGIDPFNTILDGGRIAYSYGVNISRPTIAVYDLALARETTVHAFAALPTLVDFGDGRVLATFGPPQAKTVSWDIASDTVTRLLSKRSDIADIDHDLIGFFDRDPYRGGCQVLAHLSDPTDQLWRSCKERIEVIAPDARRMATIPLLSDGIGTADVLLRTITGRGLVHYSISGHFGRIWWETPTKLLLESFGPAKTAIVRCKSVLCDRATRLVPTPPL